MKITLPQITNGQDLTNINNNFASIAAALNNNVLYRVNIGSEPNTPAQDLDFNGHKIYNLSDVLVNGVSVLTLTQAAADATGTATAAALAAQASAADSASSANASAASAVQAASAASAAGSLIAVNNLSDVPNKTTARTNLVLGNVDNTSDVNKPVSTAQQTALNLKANLASPTFTGVVTIPVGGTLTLSPNAGDSTNKIATTFYVQNALNGTQGASFTNLSTTGLLSPASTVGIKGTVAADNAQAGSIGEYLSNTTFTTAATSGVSLNATSISLTAGDWDVQATVRLVPAGSTIISDARASVTTTSATNGGLGAQTEISATLPAGFATTIASPTVRISIATTTTVFCVGQANFSTSTLTVDGFIRARRVR